MIDAGGGMLGQTVITGECWDGKCQGVLVREERLWRSS